MGRTETIVMPGDCDMYRVIFHPQMVGICERANFSAGAAFSEQPAVAIYANLAKPASIGELFNVFIFVEPAEDASSRGQTRALYLFVSRGNVKRPSSVTTVSAAQCSMCAFV